MGNGVLICGEFKKWQHHRKVVLPFLVGGMHYQQVYILMMLHLHCQRISLPVSFKQQLLTASSSSKYELCAAIGIAAHNFLIE
jgi:5,10-methylenetetrahydrofolate reductase